MVLLVERGVQWPLFGKMFGIWGNLLEQALFKRLCVWSELTVKKLVGILDSPTFTEPTFLPTSMQNNFKSHQKPSTGNPKNAIPAFR